MPSVSRLEQSLKWGGKQCVGPIIGRMMEIGDWRRAMFCCYCVVHMIVRKHMDGRMASAERDARDTAAFGFSPLSTDSGVDTCRRCRQSSETRPPDPITDIFHLPSTARARARTQRPRPPRSDPVSACFHVYSHPG